MRKALMTSILLAGSALAASPALADDAPAATPDFTITGGADVASQYRFRGISQSNNNPAFQGTFTVTHKSGFYLSTWGSSANEGNKWVDIGGTEIDVYGGYSHAFKGGLTIDGGLYGYIYPGSRSAFGSDGGLPNQSYFEVYGDASYTYGPVTGKVGVNFAPNQNYFKDFNTNTRHNVYVFGELGLALPNFPITFHSHLGHTGGGFDYGPQVKQYFDYTVGASYKWKALTFDVSYVGTDLSKHDVLDFGTGDNGSGAYRDAYNAAKGQVVGTVSVGF